MRYPYSRRLRFRFTHTVVGLLGLSMLFAFAAEALLPDSRPAYDIINTASISTSPTTVGVSDNDLYLTAGDPATVAKHLDALQSLGVTNIRIAIPWAAVEAAKGNYDWTLIDNMVNAAAARGMGVLGVVNTTPTWARGQYTNLYAPPDNPANYGNFMGTLASRYAGKISAYEVWNEPNAAFAWSGPNGPDPATYTALLKSAYTAIKASDPTAKVLGGVLGSTISWGNFALNPVDFVQQMYAAGAAGYFDALSFHPYQNTTPLSQGANLANSPLNQLNSIYALMQANGDSSKTIWSSEYGLPTGIVGQQQQADYISDYLNKWSSLPYAGPSFLYTTVDRNSSDTNDPESTFGLFTDTWVGKLAATVVKNWISAHSAPPPPPTPPTPTPAEQAAAAWAAALNAAIAQYFQNLAAQLAASLAANAAAAATPVAPPVTTTAPVVTATKLVATSTPASTPVVTTSAAPTTTSAVTPSTTAPTTSAPVTTTSAPKTTSAPVTTTSAPKTTTAPKTTAATKTTAAPKTTAATKTTAAPKSTATTPVATPTTASVPSTTATKTVTAVPVG